MKAPAGRIGRFLFSSDDPVVIRYLVRHLLIPHGTHARLRRVVLPRLPRAVRNGLSTWWGEGTADPAAGDVVAGLWDAAHDLTRAAGLPPHSEPRWILLMDPPSSERTRATLFLFARAAARPDAVLKVRDTQSAARALDEEWDSLVRVSKQSPTLRPTLPRPLAYARADGTERLLLSCLEGVSIHMRLKSGALSERVASCFVRVAEWLARLHGPAENGAGQSSVLVHGDFWPHNILLSGDGSLSGVVDWEHGTEAGSRAVDLFQFPLSYAFHCRHRRRAAAPPVEIFRGSLLEEGPLAASVRAYLRTYCASTGLPPQALHELLDVYLRTRGLPLPGAPRTHPPFPGEAALACRDALAHTHRPAFLPSCVHLS